MAMGKLDLVGWPSDQTMVLSGAAGALKIPVTVRNASDEVRQIDEASLAEVRLDGTGPPLRAEAIPIRLNVAANGVARAQVRLRLDPATPPGRYRGAVTIAGVSRPVEIEVVADVDVAIRPAPLVMDAAQGRSQSLPVAFENRGNVPLTIDLAGRYPLGEEVPIGPGKVEPPAEGIEHLTQVLNQLVGQAMGSTPRPSTVEVGSVELSMPGGPVILAPGEARTLRVAVALPDGLSPVARHHLFAPVYVADLHIVIVTAAKSLAPARRKRRTQGATG
jgi:hypothetical protein